MEPLRNEENQTVVPRRRRRKKRTAFSLPIPMPEFLRHIGEDVRWYYDVRLWSPVILLLLILALLMPGRTSRVEVPEQTEPIILETIPETTAYVEPVRPEAMALAKLADSVGAGRSDNCKIIIMWIAVNRSEAGGVDGYGLSILEEIARPNQWQGYDENITPSDHTVDLAKRVLEIQRNGELRPLDSDMLYLVLNDNGSISVRNYYVATAATKGREKVVQ